MIIKLIMYAWFSIGTLVYLYKTICELRNPEIQKSISRMLEELVIYVLFGAGMSLLALIIVLRYGKREAEQSPVSGNESEIAEND